MSGSGLVINVMDLETWVLIL